MKLFNSECFFLFITILPVAHLHSTKHKNNFEKICRNLLENDKNRKNSKLVYSWKDFDIPVIMASRFYQNITTFSRSQRRISHNNFLNEVYGSYNNGATVKSHCEIRNYLAAMVIAEDCLPCYEGPVNDLRQIDFRVRLIAPALRFNDIPLLLLLETNSPSCVTRAFTEYCFESEWDNCKSRQAVEFLLRNKRLHEGSLFDSAQRLIMSRCSLSVLSKLLHDVPTLSSSALKSLLDKEKEDVRCKRKTVDALDYDAYKMVLIHGAIPHHCDSYSEYVEARTFQENFYPRNIDICYESEILRAPEKLKDFIINYYKRLHEFPHTMITLDELKHAIYTRVAVLSKIFPTEIAFKIAKYALCDDFLEKRNSIDSLQKEDIEKTSLESLRPLLLQQLAVKETLHNPGKSNAIDSSITTLQELQQRFLGYSLPDIDKPLEEQPTFSWETFKQILRYQLTY